MFSSKGGSESYKDGLEVWFQRIYSQIKVVESMIFSTEGFLFFKGHTYTRDELLSSPELAKIDSYIGTIQNIYDNWEKNSAISDERAKFYWAEHRKVEEQFGDLRAKIYDRKPKFWEKALDWISNIINFVKKNLPMLPEMLMKRLGFSNNQGFVKMLDVNDDDV